MLLAQLPESGKFLISQGNEKDSLKVLEWMHKINNGNKDFTVHSLEQEHIPVEKNTEDRTYCGLKSFWNQTVPLLRKPLRFNFVICCFLSFGVFFVFVCNVK